MKIAEMFLTEQSEGGSYAGVRFDKSTKDAIAQYMQENDIPNPIPVDKLHTTLLYSRKFLPDYTPKGKISPVWVGTPTTFDVWESKGKLRDEEPKKCLVLEYDCDKLDDRHEELMEEHGATYDFPTYKTHITLSYDIGDLDIKDLPDITDTLHKIKIVSEYGENLDLDWSKTKGK